MIFFLKNVFIWCMARSRRGLFWARNHVLGSTNVEIGLVRLFMGEVLLKKSQTKSR